MRKDTTTLRMRAASAAAVLLVAAGASVVATSSATAYTQSNSVHNCFGRYFNTDWEQRCGGSGAGASGNYETTAVCDFESDKTMTKYRSKGNVSVYDGADCTFEVHTGQTRYF